MFQEDFIYENRQGAIICLLPGLEGLEPCPLFTIHPPLPPLKIFMLQSTGSLPHRAPSLENSPESLYG